MNMSQDLKELTEQVSLKPIENLAFEGGGVKGLVYVGALQELQKHHILKTVKRVGGSSAGGITAMLVGLGCSVKEITEEMNGMDFTKFQDAGKEFWRKVPKVMGLQEAAETCEKILTIIRSKKKGYYKGEAFLQWAEAKIAEKLGNPNATFADLKIAMDADKEGKLGLKDAMFTATNISGNGPALQIFDSDHTPNVRIADAVRATMSFPLAFEPYEIEINGIKSIFIDGGLINNFPTDHYDDERFLPPGEHLNAVGINERTLGLRVDREDEIALYKWSGREKEGRDVSSLSGYAGGVKDALLSDRAKVRKAGFGIIQINDCDVKTLKFELEPKEKEALVKSGVDCTRVYCEQYRKGAIHKIKVHKTLRGFYESKTQSELQTLKKVIQEKKDVLNKLSQKKQIELRNRESGSIGLREFERSSESIQREISSLLFELNIIDVVLSKFEKERGIKAIVKLCKSLLDLEINQVGSSHVLLENYLNEIKALKNELDETLKTLDEKLSLFKRTPETIPPMTGAFKAIRELYLVRIKQKNEILMLKTKREALIDALKAKEPGEAELKLMNDLHAAELRNLQFFEVEKNKTQTHLKVSLEKLIHEGKLNSKESDILKNIVAYEFLKLKEGQEQEEKIFQDEAYGFEKYYKNLRIGRLELEQTLKKIEQDQTLERYTNLLLKNEEILKSIQKNKQVMGENPSKMLEVAFKLERLIKIQQKTWPTLAAMGRGLLFLLGNVFSIAYVVARVVIKKVATPEAYKTLIEDFERKFNSEAENFIERAEHLKKEIEERQSEFLTMKNPSEDVRKYMVLLNKALDLAIKLPKEKQLEYKRFIEIERTRAEKEQSRIKEMRFTKSVDEYQLGQTHKKYGYDSIDRTGLGLDKSKPSSTTKR